MLLTVFAIAALCLSTMGTYGVLAYLVNQGTRELGIRMALSATPHEVLVLILRQGLAVTASGVAAGLVGAVIATRFMESLLFGVSGRDPATFVAVPSLLMLAALTRRTCPQDVSHVSIG